MKTKRLLSIVLTLLLVVTMMPTLSYGYSKEQATLTFNNDGVQETVAGNGYTITGTTLSITAAGTYRVKGSCTEGKIEVAKGLSDVTLILDNLTLANSNTAPIVIKKTTSTLIKLVGTSTITNNEDAARETTDPDNYEGAAIKVKSGSSLTVFGDGTLKAIGNSKNAIKGGSESTLLVDGGTIQADAVNNAIAFDGSIIINAGNFKIASDNDGIKAVPDEGDTASAGKITINGGTFDIDVDGDGIQAAENLTINNGSFDIKTLNGYNGSGFNADTMSCKGLKASGNNNQEEPTNELVVNGGEFTINTADDAIHSDGYCDILGGTFDIYAGDDGVHADATLTLGREDGLHRDPEINIYSSYEGLEGVTVDVYSGKFYVIASDDGMNAAGGSSNGTGGGNQDPFNPGGQRPGQGGPGGPGGFNPGGESSSGNYTLNIYGGSFYIDCQGDGLDSNGALNLLGGNITVLSMRASGDNSPLDADGTITIKGATVFGAGSRGMGVNLSSGSQSAYTNTNSYNANTVINITSSGSVVRSEKMVRNINYLIYSSPSMGTCSVSTSSSVVMCASNAFAHNWLDGVVAREATETETGLVRYNCRDCDIVEYKTLAKLATVNEYVESGKEATTTVNNTVYTGTFNTDSHATINVYYTQDYTAPDATNVKTATARNSSTGAEDGSGDGQINFAVVVADGYEIDSVTVSGSYKNLKTPSDLGTDNIYRITKVAGDLTITVTTKQKTATDETTTQSQVTTEQTTTMENTTSADVATTSTSTLQKPAKVKITKVFAKKKSAKKLKLKIKKLAGVKGYQVAVYKTKKNAKKNKKALVKKFIKKNVAKLVISSKKLKGKKNLFVRVRGYYKGETVVYGDWSAIKKVKVK